MLYGASGHLPIDFLDKLASYKIPLMIHRRNMPSPYLFFPDSGNDSNDILSKQILTRANATKSTYIARTLIRARFRSMEYLIPIAQSYYLQLNKYRSITEIRILEAEVTARYWKAYFKNLDFDADMIRRDKSHPVNRALDAASYFLSGILLRWILFHKLSPEHGYLHVQTTYPSLIFDLIEPYRYIFEKALIEVFPKGGLCEGTLLTGALINQVKKHLATPVYVPATRQTVNTKNLYHGIVLALRAYLCNDMNRFIIPVAGEKNGGRPLKVTFKMPGGMKNNKS